MANAMSSKIQEASNDASSKAFFSAPEECKSSIRSIIESDIIPRLLSSQSIELSSFRELNSDRALPLQHEIEEFVLLCIDDDPDAAQIFVDRMLHEGLSKENIFLELITPAARLMGTQWETDLMDFYKVTHGLARLHTLTHNIGFSYQKGPMTKGDVKRIMISSAPGSEHLLGPTIVSEFFRKDGWQVVMEISPTVNELVQAVGNEWFDAIGLSISIQAQLKDLSVLIAQIKKLSRNPNAVVLLGGPIFTIQNFNASDFGADAICTDAKDAVEMTLSLIKND
jgi:hypothetical protein